MRIDSLGTAWEDLTTRHQRPHPTREGTPWRCSGQQGRRDWRRSRRTRGLKALIGWHYAGCISNSTCTCNPCLRSPSGRQSSPPAIHQRRRQPSVALSAPARQAETKVRALSGTWRATAARAHRHSSSPRCWPLLQLLLCSAHTHSSSRTTTATRPQRRRCGGRCSCTCRPQQSATHSSPSSRSKCAYPVMHTVATH